MTTAILPRTFNLEKKEKQPIPPNARPRHVKVIAQTLKEIDSVLVVVLLGKIAARLASTPLRAEPLAVCFRIVQRRVAFMQPFSS